MSKIFSFKEKKIIRFMRTNNFLPLFTDQRQFHILRKVRQRWRAKGKRWIEGITLQQLMNVIRSIQASGWLPFVIEFKLFCWWFFSINFCFLNDTIFLRNSHRERMPCHSFTRFVYDNGKHCVCLKDINNLSKNFRALWIVDNLFGPNKTNESVICIRKKSYDNRF